MNNSLYESLKDKFEHLNEISQHCLLEYDAHKMKCELAHPDPRPAVFDVTFQAWFHRLELMWGKVTITYKDPEKFLTRKVSQAEYIKIITEPCPFKTLGQWHIESPTITRVIVTRDYLNAKGKVKTQKFTIDIELKPELKKLI